MPGDVVFGHVVVSAERPEVVVVGGPALGVGPPVVEVAVVGGPAASHEDTGLVPGSETSFLGRAGATTGRPGCDHLPVVGDLVGPFPVDLSQSRLAGDFGEHRAVSGEFTGDVG